MATYPSYFFTQPFAAEGDYSDTPDVQSVAGDGYASLTTGFPPECSRPIESGGIPPRRKDLNGILREITEHICWLQTGGIYYWSQSTPYAPPCIVYDQGYLWIALNSSIGQRPADGSAYWRRILTSEDVQSATMSIDIGSTWASPMAGTKIAIELKINSYVDIDGQNPQDIFTCYLNGVSVGTIPILWRSRRSGGAGYGRSISNTSIGLLTLNQSFSKGDVFSFARTSGTTQINVGIATISLQK